MGVLVVCGLSARIDLKERATRVRRLRFGEFGSIQIYAQNGGAKKQFLGLRKTLQAQKHNANSNQNAEQSNARRTEREREKKREEQIASSSKTQANE